MGVETTVSLPIGYALGPLPNELMITHPSLFVIQMTNDEHSISRQLIKINPLVSNVPGKLIEWIFHIEPAREPNEQNLELKLHQTDNGKARKLFYYVTTRPINSGERLRVWLPRVELTQNLLKYIIEENFIDKNPISSVFGNQIILAWLGHEIKTENFICVRCQSEFIHIYPFIAHILYKCIKSPQSTDHLTSQNEYLQYQPTSDASKQGVKVKNSKIPNNSKDEIIGNPLTKFIKKHLKNEPSSIAIAENVLLNLEEKNWCALCSKKFRLTSDLVSHVRTNHRDENIMNNPETVDNIISKYTGNLEKTFRADIQRYQHNASLESVNISFDEDFDDILSSIDDS